MGAHNRVTPHLALPRLRDRHPLPKGDKVLKNQNSSHEVARARRNAKAKSFLSVATFAYFATLRETGLPIHGLIHRFRRLGS
jgi:hypothetical protein